MYITRFEKVPIILTMIIHLTYRYINVKLIPLLTLKSTTPDFLNVKISCINCGHHYKSGYMIMCMHHIYLDTINRQKFTVLGEPKQRTLMQ